MTTKFSGGTEKGRQSGRCTPRQSVRQSNVLNPPSKSNVRLSGPTLVPFFEFPV